MNRSKKNDPKKILVRNTVRPVPKTRLITEEKKENKNKEKKATHFKEVDNKKTTNFQCPELNTALKISKKIEEVEKTKSQKTKCTPDLAFSEKITRKINFPADQAIYKDLIPIQIPCKSSPVLSARDPLPQKDKEPTLSSFIKPKPVKEFIYMPSVKFETQPLSPGVNNLKLYKVLQANQ